MITTDCESRAVLLFFFLPVIAVDFALCDIFESILWHVIFMDGNLVFVPSALPSVPWVNLPISLPCDIPHSSLYFGHWMRYRYSNNSPVSPFITALANSHINFIGNLLDTKFCGFIVPHMPGISRIVRSASCAIDLVVPLDRVLYAGLSFSYTVVGVDLDHCMCSVYALFPYVLCFFTLSRSASLFL